MATSVKPSIAEEDGSCCGEGAFRRWSASKIAASASSTALPTSFWRRGLRIRPMMSWAAAVSSNCFAEEPVIMEAFLSSMDRKTNIPLPAPGSPSPQLLYTSWANPNESTFLKMEVGRIFPIMHRPTCRSCLLLSLVLARLMLLRMCATILSSRSFSKPSMYPFGSQTAECSKPARLQRFAPSGVLGLGISATVHPFLLSDSTSSLSSLSAHVSTATERIKRSTARLYTPG
mmetsp:Transcript_28515/g.58307  ORF Transcript_28515/g.58307 Transcript_28515/m.58307 type:complete len:231 (-) Transcript_28515:53-745(-)